MKMLKESISNDAKERGEIKLSMQATINNATSTATSATSATTFATSVITRSSDTYIYGNGIVAVLVIAACVFFAYNTKSSQAANKEPIKQCSSMLRYDVQKSYI